MLYYCDLYYTFSLLYVKRIYDHPCVGFYDALRVKQDIVYRWSRFPVFLSLCLLYYTFLPLSVSPSLSLPLLHLADVRGGSGAALRGQVH